LYRLSPAGEKKKKLGGGWRWELNEYAAGCRLVKEYYQRLVRKKVKAEDKRNIEKNAPAKNLDMRKTFTTRNVGKLLGGWEFRQRTSQCGEKHRLRRSEESVGQMLSSTKPKEFKYREPLSRSVKSGKEGLVEEKEKTKNSNWRAILRLANEGEI